MPNDPHEGETRQAPGNQLTERAPGGSDMIAGVFARRDFHGRLRTADEVHSMSLANLDGEYCTVLDTTTALAESQGDAEELP